MNLGIALVAVVAPAGCQEKVHDMQSETGFAAARLFVQKASLGHAADVTDLADARLEGVRVDLNVFWRLVHV